MSEAPTNAAAWPPAWPRALDAAFGAPWPGEYRACAEDFVVEECLDFAPEGQGEHLWLWIEKRELTTLEAVRRLAELCQVSPRAVGYSGMKDRIAVTRQWLSVQLPGREAPAGLAEALAERGMTLLESARHPRKLKRGVHRANRFSLVIRGAAVDDPRLEARWAWLCAHGVPNAFGPQRFGHQGRNLARARAVLARGWRKRDDRQGMLLSAARSYLFNELLAMRLTDGTWNTLVSGEVAILDGTASQFVVECVDESLAERAERLDLHPGGVLWGSGDSQAAGEAAAFEQALRERHPGLCGGLERAEVRLARRALRMRLSAPQLTREADCLRLDFRLPRGGFATAVLRELIDHPTLNFETALSGH
ncbi:tRNA pseudouridine(13) synthase TruD [Halomonas campisalis]|uniref:tRNA pseudouridine synthase D n=1 Tax=Billgrantia campisalis TaxID=74661 RepID=A0ABS9P8H5_9GAMM|nr:tRNA pseudouridine(13) synthase TruD [Halomonas campisalis]MCG6658082.1 tRNA pseudouridine(13) synthase TruD [Halomonas campisalis]MDR5862748.1 tRNA pseudouridine(13) synthase TruD [Halomonas campisalis]